MNSDKKIKLCSGNILADDKDLDSFILGLKNLHQGKRSEDLKNYHHTFSLKPPNSREWASRFDLRVCGPQAESFPVQGAACASEAALTDEATGAECELHYCTTEMAADNQFQDSLGPLRAEGSRRYQHRKNALTAQHTSSS